ncbi:MAG: beta-L-arabinofuranosidase domain-containing protein [Candidatus Omnitrophota bacterium]
MTRVIPFLAAIFFSALLLANAADKAYQKLSPIPYTEVKIEDGFWSPRLEINRTVTIPKNLEWCEKTGRISNFAKAAGLMEGEFEGIYFNDSDVYKALEAASYSLANHLDPALDKKVDDIIATIAAAQQKDGYLNCYYTLVKPKERWSNLKDMHELYCAGHLIEAAVAHYQATGKRTLLDVAIKYADLIESIFGPDKRHGVPGHEEIELALVKLYRLTGAERYLQLAQFFVDERGRADGRELYGKYAQDHIPVREQMHVFGHAVRAMYLFSGVADLAAITGDKGYFKAMDGVWTDMTTHKMYITGGIGVSGHGEGFSGGYDLPNEDAYSETCAAIALAFFNARLNWLYGDAKYMDVFEQSLYNGLLSGVSLDGDKFFYRNPLASHGPEKFDPSGGKVADSHQHRQYWFGCACCPPNVARFIPKIGEYIYAAGQDGAYINLYICSQSRFSLNGVLLTLSQSTEYPWDGAVRVNVDPEEPAEFAMNLRIPGWRQGASLRVNGRKADYVMNNGYARIERRWQRGDAIQLDLPMPIQRVEAHPFVKEDVGRLALQRGPMVYCLEEIDNAADVFKLALPRDAQVTANRRPDLLGGVVVIEGEAAMRSEEEWKGKLYRPAADWKKVPFTAIPYYAWDNRKAGAMAMWLPEIPALTPFPTIASQSRASSSREGANLDALNDRIESKSSNDASIPRFTWRDRKGTTEWAQYDFPKSQTVSSVQIYWFDDRDKGGCRVPQSWKLLYKDGKDWKPIAGVSEYGTALHQFNHADFDAVTTTSLRVEVELLKDYSGGILEWSVLE